jgi:hypothetical protein
MHVQAELDAGHIRTVVDPNSLVAHDGRLHRNGIDFHGRSSRGVCCAEPPASYCGCVEESAALA